MIWYTPEGAARARHMRESSVAKLIRSGELESHAKPSGRGVLVSERAIDALVESWPSGAKVPGQIQSMNCS